MQQNPENLEHHDPEELQEEVNDLKEELEHFQKDKERVRAIVGAVGGMPKLNTKVMNWIFIVFIVTTLLISIIAGEHLRLILIEIAVAAVSIKIIYLIHSLMKVNHFKFWMLSSIEWRLNEMNKRLKDMEKHTEKEKQETEAADSNS